MQKIRQYVSIENSVAIVEVEGEYSLGVTTCVKEELEEAYRRGCTSVRFEMMHTDYIDSAVTKLIARTNRRVGEKNLQILNPKARVYAVFHTAAMDKFLVMNGEQSL